MLGETIGNFRIVSKIGRGGMGEVFAGEHVGIHTRVAIKMLRPEVSGDQVQVQRFFNEAIAVSRIKHAGIVKIFDVGTHAASGRAYLIMELLEGETLGARLARSGRLTAWQVADLGKQIASVLEATHAAGITHRDLKPDNVFLVPDVELDSKERVKILDFGIAKLATGGPGTTTGSMGTPTYMAPEQWRSSANVDWRTDAYSLGCLAFEMACGRPPFVAESIAEACTMHLHDPPPTARSLVPTLAPELDALLAALLAKDPAQRPESMAAIGRAFAALRTGEPPTVARTQPDGRVPVPSVAPTVGRTTLGAAASASVGSSPRPRRLGWLVGGALGTAVVVGGASWLVFHAPEAPAAVQPSPVPAPAPEAVVTPLPVTPASIAIEPSPNAWVRIEAPARPVVLGVDTDRAPDDRRGFRPARRVLAPTAAYELQQHEVTWSELEPWLARNPDAQAPTIPPWATDPVTRARLPATDVTWSTAYAYCKALGGSLPTEAQWELAARGPERRPNAWGAAKVELARTHALAGHAAVPVPVMTSEQDVTPDGRLYDLMGNVQEWTFDLWREDKPGLDEAWVEEGAQTYRPLRGLPLAVPVRPRLQPDAAAYREPLCATGACVAATREKLRYVGWRCARPVDGVAAGAWRAASAPRPAVVAAVDAAGPVTAALVAADPDPTPPDVTEADPAPPSAPAPAAPPPPPPPSSLTTAMISAAVAPVRATILRCAAGGLASGRVKVGVTVAPSGAITSVEVRETPDDWLGRCVATRIQAARFPATPTGGTFAYAFDF